MLSIHFPHTFNFVMVSGRSQTMLRSFLSFSNHLPSYVDIFYLTIVDKKVNILDYLPTSSCQRSL